MKDKFYITTAIAYASRKPHIGNVYEAIMTDSIARYKRQLGFDVYFLTGTDEHGQKIENLANEKGIEPQAYVDSVAGEIKGIWDLMNISYTKFIRTTDSYHERAVQNIFKKLYDRGDIYKSEYEGWYCEPCESFFTETQVTDGKCPDCGSPVKRTKEEAYFFKMSAYGDRLIKYIEDHPDFITPESRKREMINNFLKPGLQDLCVSRTSFKWGVPVTFDDKHVIYVWIDALSNYITALGYDTDEQGEDFKKYWPADVHVIGKDIMRFHSIYWSIILMALDLPLPKTIFGHPWLNFGTDKMSKSKGNVIYADKLAEKIGVDGVRYYSLAEMPYAQDGSITYESVVARYNSDLANNLGNLVNRTAVMTKKYFGGVIPSPDAPDALDDELKAACEKAVAERNRLMDDFHIADALESVFALFRRANKYIDETEPWVLAKDPESKARLGTVLYNLLAAIRVGAVLLYPFMPDTSDSILSQLSSEDRSYDFDALASGVEIAEPKVLFARLDEKAAIEELIKAAEQDAPAKVEKPEPMPEINIEAFMANELRTAQIIDCEPVPKAKKLLKIQLDLGYEKRQVVSGIAEYYTPDKLIGKKVIVVANLKPVTLRGVESNGMILASSSEDGGDVRVVFLSDDTPLGERVR